MDPPGSSSKAHLDAHPPTKALTGRAQGIERRVLHLKSREGQKYDTCFDVAFVDTVRRHLQAPSAE